MRMNEDCYYSPAQRDALRDSALIWLRVAKQMGKEDHPRAEIERQNLALIERIENASN